jgi:hypothetical protein
MHGKPLTRTIRLLGLFSAMDGMDAMDSMEGIRLSGTPSEGMQSRPLSFPGPV